MRIFLFLMLLFSPLLSLAETVYVTDQLKLSVRPQPASNEAPVATVLSGDALEVLEKNDSYWKVRTPDNVEGWVNGRYVTSDVPAVVRLRELQAQQADAGSATEATGQELADTLEQNKRLEKEVGELRQKNHELQARLHEAFDPLSATTGLSPAELLFKYRWAIGAGIIVLLPLFGFIGGIRWYKRRISARLGGFQF